MGRKYQRKNGGEPLTDAQVKAFVIRKHTSGLSFRKSAQRGISKSSLHRMYKKCGLTDLNLCTLKRSVHCRQVFSQQQETELAAYLIVAQKLNHGLTPVDTRKLAFIYARANQVKMPSSWQAKEQAGKDWFTMFVKRNQSLSIRKPERTSQARAAAVNHPVIDKFYDELLDLLIKYGLKEKPEKIFNCDETNNPTVVDPQNIVGEKGAKSVGIKIFKNSFSYLY